MAIQTLEVPRAHWKKICARWQAGDSQKAIGKDHGVSPGKIKKILLELNAYDRIKRPRVGNGTDVKAFLKAARSILWRHDGGTDHPSFEKWEKRVADLMSGDGGGLSKNEAIIRASKEFNCLHRLFREYDVSAFDPNPESHPTIKYWGDASGIEVAEGKVKFEGIEYSYRDSLRWAADQAGNFLSTGKHPESAPNGTAWFFYRQAIDEPKDFMSKVGSMESKTDESAGEAGKKTACLAIEEIHEHLEKLEEKEEEK